MNRCCSVVQSKAINKNATTRLLALIKAAQQLDAQTGADPGKPKQVWKNLEISRRKQPPRRDAPGGGGGSGYGNANANRGPRRPPPPPHDPPESSAGYLDLKDG